MITKCNKTDTYNFMGPELGIVACSNGLPEEACGEIGKVISLLERMGRHIVVSPYIYAGPGGFSGAASERAGVLMEMFKNTDISDIFDISGGDMANEILEDLDFEIIKNSRATFWGYSDLTTIINSIFTMTGRSSVLYQIRNLAGPYASLQRERIFNNQLFSLNYSMVQGDGMEGIVIGGNIRCFLKLAGTKYLPDFHGRVLLLEAMGGRVPQMVTYLNQLKQMGAFEQISGILLGTFTLMDAEKCTPQILDLVKMYAGNHIPVAVTREIGHGKNAKAIIIGEKYKFEIQAD